MHNASNVAESCPLALLVLLQVLQNSGSQMFMLRKLCQHMICTGEIQYNSACVSPLTGSEPRKLLRGCREFQLVAGIDPILPDLL